MTTTNATLMHDVAIELARSWFTRAVEANERSIALTHDEEGMAQLRRNADDERSSARQWLDEDEWMAASEVAGKLVVEAGLSPDLIGESNPSTRTYVG
jgi:hypothetical protein